jgi:hypothetical protein
VKVRARPADQALAVPVEPVSRLDPSGFDPSRIECPSQHGVILGEALSDIAKAGDVGLGILFAACATCAFREGCMTNQMAATGMLALNCVLGIDPEEFACHHGMKNGQPTKLCAGYLAAKNAPKPIVQAALQTIMARMNTLPARDEVRERFDAWAAEADPNNEMDNYARSRAYTKASAIEAQRATTVQQGVVHESAVPERQTPEPGSRGPDNG